MFKSWGRLTIRGDGADRVETGGRGHKAGGGPLDDTWLSTHTHTPTHTHTLLRINSLLEVSQ